MEDMSRDNLYDKLVKKLNYLTKDEMISLLSTIIPEREKRFTLFSSLLFIKGRVIGYLKFDYSKNEYRAISEIRDTSLNFNQSIEAGPVENTFVFAKDNDLYSYDIKSNTVKNFLNIANLALFRKGKEVGTYLIQKIKGNKVNQLLLLDLRSNKKKLTTKINFETFDYINNIREVNYNTFIVSISNIHHVYYKGKHLSISDQRYSLDYLFNDCSLSSLISWGIVDYSKLLTILENGEIKEEILDHSAQNLDNIQVIFLNCHMIAEFGNKGHESGPTVVNIYSYYNKKITFVQAIKDIKLPTPLNDNYFITVEKSEATSIWHLVDNYYIKIQELKYGFNKVVLLPAGKDDRKNLIKILTPLVPLPKVLTEFVVNFL